MIEIVYHMLLWVWKKRIFRISWKIPAQKQTLQKCCYKHCPREYIFKGLFNNNASSNEDKWKCVYIYILYITIYYLSNHLHRSALFIYKTSFISVLFNYNWKIRTFCQFFISHHEVLHLTVFFYIITSETRNNSSSWQWVWHILITRFMSWYWGQCWNEYWVSLCNIILYSIILLPHFWASSTKTYLSL